MKKKDLELRFVLMKSNSIISKSYRKFCILSIQIIKTSFFIDLQKASPSFLTKIHPKTFYECASLKQVTITPSVTKIDDEAFYKCISMKITEKEYSKLYIHLK